MGSKFCYTTPKVYKCDRCNSLISTDTPPTTIGWKKIDGRTLCEDCYIHDADTGEAIALLDNRVHVTFRHKLRDPDNGDDGCTTIVANNWKLDDGATTADHFALMDSALATIQNQARQETRATADPTGTWIITYDKTGDIHDAQRPQD